MLQPASVDLRLARTCLVFRTGGPACIDPKPPAEELMEAVEVGADEPLVLHPRRFVLASTVERVRAPDDLVGDSTGTARSGAWGLSSTAPPPGPSWPGERTESAALT